MEATELSNEVEKQEHTTQEVSSSLLGEETTEESSKKEEVSLIRMSKLGFLDCFHTILHLLYRNLYANRKWKHMMNV